MKHSLTLEVANTGDGESELKFTYEDNVVTIYLDDQEICRTDYDSSFVFFLQNALKYWGFAKEFNNEG